MTTVSIVIPVYNRSEALKRALASVTAQTYQDFEVIVVDDASEEDLSAVVAAAGDERVRLIRHEKNRYAGAARNTGIRASRGKFVAFLDSDDEWYPEKLSLQLEAIGDRRSVCSCTGVLMTKGRGIVEKTWLPRSSGMILGDYLRNRTPVITSTFMFARPLVERVGLMDERLRRNQDVDFFIRMLANAECVSVRKALVKFNANVAPPSLEVIEESNRLLLSKNAEILASLGPFEHRRVLAHYAFRHGQRCLVRGHLKDGLRHLSRGMLKNPLLPPRQYAAATYKLLMCLGRVSLHSRPDASA